MKNKITTLALALFTGALTFAGANEPDSMYVHLTGINGNSIVSHAIADIDSIVYYAPVVVEEQGIDWDNVAEGVAQANALTDADGNSYSAVKIGTQIWMSSNLAVSATNITDGIDGDTASAVCGIADAYVWSNTDASYGKLYSWEAATLACPVGWHLPTLDEWKILRDYLSVSHSDSEGEVLKSTTGWNNNGDGTDNYGFTALPAGLCWQGDFNGSQGYQCEWWTSPKDDDTYAFTVYISSLGDYISMNSRKSCAYGISVRYLRD